MRNTNRVVQPAFLPATAEDGKWRGGHGGPPHKLCVIFGGHRRHREASNARSVEKSVNSWRAGCPGFFVTAGDPTVARSRDSGYPW